RALDPTNASDAESPSYPVFVDPIGWNVNIGDNNWREWVAGWVASNPDKTTATPKRMCIRELNPLASPPGDPNPKMSLSSPQFDPQYRTQQVKRWCTSLD